MKNKWIKSALTFATVLILTLVLEGCSSEQEKRETAAKALAVKQAAEAKVIAEAKALAEKQAAEAKVIAEAKALAEKRLELTGTVVAWGLNIDGQTKVPAGLSGVVAIAGGAYHTVALKQDGTVVAWGDNGIGQTRVPAGLSGVVAIAAGRYHTVALRLD